MATHKINNLKIYLVFSDIFLFGGLEPILAELEKRLNCKRIPDTSFLIRRYYKTQREAGKFKDSIIEVDDSVYDNIVPQLIEEEIARSKTDIIIRSYPRTTDQFNKLLEVIGKNDFSIERILYFESSNVIRNLYKVEKYFRAAQKADPTLSHIKEATLRSKN